MSTSTTSPTTPRATHDAPVNTNATSLCIPRVFKNITRERIIRCFGLALGVDDEDADFIERVDMVARTDKNDQEYWRVFLHLRYFPDTEEGQLVRERIERGDTVTIVYDEPWFWKVTMSRIVKTGNNNRSANRPRPYLSCEETKPSATTTSSKSSKSGTSGNSKPIRRQRLSISTANATVSSMAAEDFCDP